MQNNINISLLKEQVIDKIDGYLNGQQKKIDVYQWAQDIVIGPSFKEICKVDELLGDSIQALFELHHDDGKFDPSKKELIEYRDSLKQSLE